MKKFSGLLAIALISFVLIFASQSCKKDDDNDDGGNTPDPSAQFIGKYVFTDATFNASPPSPIIMPPDSLADTLNPGDNANLFVGGGLFKDSPCADPTQTALELRTNKELYYICLDASGEAQLGVWSYNATDGFLSLTINMAGSPVPFEVRIANATISNSILTGNIVNLPLPINAYYDIGVVVGGVINMQMGNVAVSFNKIP